MQHHTLPAYSTVMMSRDGTIGSLVFRQLLNLEPRYTGAIMIVLRHGLPAYSTDMTSKEGAIGSMVFRQLLNFELQNKFYKSCS